MTDRKAFRDRDDKLYGRVKMKAHNQFLLSGVAAIAMLANAAPAMAQAAPDPDFLHSWHESSFNL